MVPFIERAGRQSAQRAVWSRQFSRQGFVLMSVEQQIGGFGQPVVDVTVFE